MPEQVTKDPVSLDDLKRAIEAVYNGHPHIEYTQLECLAWRTAFEWREGWRCRCRDIAPQSIQWSSHCDEGDEGMRLIREKLQS